MELVINDRIRKRTVSRFNSFKLGLKHDSVASTFAFSFYFDPTSKDQAETACVSHYHEVQVTHLGKTLLTGYILSNTFNDSAVKQLVEIGGYSKPGVIEDCDIPVELYPLEINGMSLTEITQKLISKFGFGLVVDTSAAAQSSIEFEQVDDPAVASDGTIDNDNSDLGVSPSLSTQDKIDKKITRANAKESTNIKSFLVSLATPRNVLYSHDEKGNLLITDSNVFSAPILDFDVPRGGLIGTHMALSFNGQGIHSHITAVKQSDMDNDNEDIFTIRNPYVPVAAIYRPRVISVGSSDDISAKEAAMQALAAELKNIVLTITIDRWDNNKQLILPNNTLTVKNPNVFLYKKCKWFIEEIAYEGDATKNTAVLKCVPVEVYNKQYPQNVFVDPDENLPRI